MTKRRSMPNTGPSQAPAVAGTPQEVPNQHRRAQAEPPPVRSTEIRRVLGEPGTSFLGSAVPSLSVGRR